MNMLANGKANASDLFRSDVVRHLIVCVTLMTITLTIKPALAAPEDEVRATFDRFVAAQNAHDIKDRMGQESEEGGTEFAEGQT